jgi:hypothetical protein
MQFKELKKADINKKGTNSDWKPLKSRPKKICFKNEPISQGRADELILNYIVNSMKPLSTVNDVFFKEMINE